MAVGPNKYLKPFLSRMVAPFARWYLRKERKSQYQDVTVTVPPGVFHPGMFFSTKLMLRHLGRYAFQGKTVLELGSGSGIVSIWCAKRGATVTAVDVSPRALEATRQNASANAVEVSLVASDLFSNLPAHPYDYILINPPYYPGTPKDETEMAFFCGEDFEYFRRLFEDLHRYRHPESKVLMILNEDCNINKITEIARKGHWDMEIIHSDRRLGEWSFVFSLRYKRVE